MWDIKYRPTKFADVLGQEGNVKLLKARLAHGTAFDTSYIFMGGHGQGKTTLARIHARAMLCQRLDKADPEPCNECENCQAVLRDQSEAFSERDAASQGKIEHIRTLIEKLGFAVGNARMRIELFDEAHRIGDGAQDVLLKPLEEKKLVGMFCTTEPNKIKGTIRTRCEEYVIRKVTRDDVLKRAQYVCKSEGVLAEDDALLMIIDNSGGHIRDILNKMEMISQIGGITVDNTREYLHLAIVSIYYDILLSLSNPAKAIELIDQACENVAPEEIVAGLAEAAMNSYRLANGMYTEFVMVDRDKGKQVHDLYGLGCITLAEYFLHNKYASRVTLMRDVLLLTRYKGNIPPPDGTRLPVFLGGALPTGTQTQESVAQVAQVQASQAVQEVTPASSPQPQVQAPYQETSGPQTTGTLPPLNQAIKDPRLHGFGPGQGDIPAPRKKDDAKAHIPLGTLSSPKDPVSSVELKPEEWTRHFIAKRNCWGSHG